MATIALEKYQSVVSDLMDLDNQSIPDSLLMERDGPLSIYYAPFDYVNSSARVVICGITPGRSQALTALKAASAELRAGKTVEEADYAAKHTASFAGAMRTNLVAMLDHLSVNDLLDIGSCADLFGARADLVHYTSALRYPVFRDGKNYSGSPSMANTPLLRRQLETHLFPELSQFPEPTLIVPLGSAVEAALMLLVDAGGLQSHQVLRGLPHPSGANAERIKYFLGAKAKEALSTKTNANIIDAGKTLALTGLKRLSAGVG